MQSLGLSDEEIKRWGQCPSVLCASRTEIMSICVYLYCHMLEYCPYVGVYTVCIMY